MAENTFRFKQFEIKQENCAMKVGTDGVLIGAWAKIEDAQHILDVGTGTGLIAIMLAQRTHSAKITAIDIDKDSYLQAKENVAKSNWNHRINVMHHSMQEFSSDLTKKFELIVSNPPYFSNAFKPVNQGRSLARHTDTLSFVEFFQYAVKLLTSEGRIAMIIPNEIHKGLIETAEGKGFFLKRLCTIFPNPEKPAKRMMLEFSKCHVPASEIVNEDLTIELYQRHIYSPKYMKLTADFYLKF
jgi:tRNA1Val (adenine37-N6)-methyltransferase